ncbi:MAG: hypothetical protein U9Q12_04190 [Patescibacteria group bacterium]|nr:hypothetical protein [Patescibacteria group bacterium]
MKFLRIFLLAVGLLSIVGFSTTLSVSAWSPGEQLVPCGKDINSKCTICDLSLGMHNIIAFFMYIMSAAALVVIVVAGIIYISSAGNQQMTTMAKSAIKNAFIGLIVMLTAFLIITFLLNTIFNKTNVVSEGGLTVTQFGRMWTFECP